MRTVVVEQLVLGNRCDVSAVLVRVGVDARQTQPGCVVEANHPIGARRSRSVVRAGHVVRFAEIVVGDKLDKLGRGHEAHHLFPARNQKVVITAKVPVFVPATHWVVGEEAGRNRSHEGLAIGLKSRLPVSIGSSNLVAVTFAIILPSFPLEQTINSWEVRDGCRMDEEAGEQVDGGDCVVLEPLPSSVGVGQAKVGAATREGTDDGASIVDKVGAAGSKLVHIVLHGRSETGSGISVLEVVHVVGDEQLESKNSGEGLSDQVGIADTFALP
mmetsp:Transcript_30173/g.89796  ORF Transcript_30173/g.89796 Transcript_30173/m.89796 type:complete len:272 (+) Transcript_30173:748-1563(+)